MCKQTPAARARPRHGPLQRAAGPGQALSRPPAPPPARDAQPRCLPPGRAAAPDCCEGSAGPSWALWRWVPPVRRGAARHWRGGSRPLTFHPAPPPPAASFAARPLSYPQFPAPAAREPPPSSPSASLRHPGKNRERRRRGSGPRLDGAGGGWSCGGIPSGTVTCAGGDTPKPAGHAWERRGGGEAEAWSAGAGVRAPPARDWGKAGRREGDLPVEYGWETLISCFKVPCQWL